MKLRHYLFKKDAEEKARKGFGLIHKALGGPKYRAIRKARLEGRFYAHPTNAEFDSACVRAEFEEVEVSALLASGRLFMADLKAADLLREASEHLLGCSEGMREGYESRGEVVERCRKTWGKQLRVARRAYLDSWQEIADESQIPEIQEPDFIPATWDEMGFGSFAEQKVILEFVWIAGPRTCGPSCPYDCDSCPPERRK